MRRALTPRGFGYHMPAEWNPHKATWLAWPHMHFAKYWGVSLEPVQSLFLQIIHALKDSEKVHLMVVDYDMGQDVKMRAKKEKISLDHVVFYKIRTSDVWTRDYGPIFVVNPQTRDVAITHWMFTSWGKKKYFDLVSNVMVPAKIHEIDKTTYFNAEMILEGGSIEVNGQGLLLTTRQCLHNKNREKYSMSTIEMKLNNYLGIDRVVWLDRGLVNDDTDGHIDNLARFVNSHHVVLPLERDTQDINYRVLLENALQCQLALGKDYQISFLPTPEPVYYGNIRLAASYANFYIANRAVLVPAFGNKKRDQEAAKVLQAYFPKRKVFSLDCQNLIPSGGAIHCITQQQPKAR